MIELKNCLDNLKKISPLTLAVTNQVTINACANGLLAVGASPVMSDDPQDAAALAELAAATVINIGTVSDYRLQVMLAAVAGARKAGRPVILDPVGVGATEVRRRAALDLIKAGPPDIIRGNFAEIKALAGLTSEQKGVDSNEEEKPEAMAEIAAELSGSLGTVVAITGATDVVAQGSRINLITGGSPWLTRLTGTGCLLSALAGAYAGANPDRLALSLTAALVHMSLAGERTEAAIKGETAGGRGPALGTFGVGLFDHLALIEGRDLAEYQGVRQL